MDGCRRRRRAVRRFGGVARTSTLLALGATPREIARAVHREAIVRVRKGVYSVPESDPDLVRSARAGGELACVSALRARGVWTIDDGRHHVRVGSNGRRYGGTGSATSPVFHHGGRPAGFGATGLVDALLQCARCQGAECFFAAFESAWAMGLLTASDRVEVRSALPAGMRFLVDLARSDAGCGLESILRLRLFRLGLALERQVWIPGVGRVDFVLAGCIVLEVDGKGNHEGAPRRHRDLVRDAVAASLGFETLRFDYALVIHDWPTVERAILGRLAAIGRRRHR